jgi:hypothetical protein
MIHFTCPQCHQAVQANDKAVGSHHHCPKCGTLFIVPTSVGPRAAQSMAGATRPASPKPPETPAIPAIPLVDWRPQPAGLERDPKSRLTALPSRVSLPESNTPEMPSDKKSLVGCSGVFALVVVGLLVWYFMYHHRWEITHYEEVVKKVGAADRIRASDPFKAYDSYMEVVNEAAKHKVSDEMLIHQIERARTAIAELFPAVKAERDRRAAEIARIEEARRTAVLVFDVASLLGLDLGTIESSLGVPGREDANSAEKALPTSVKVTNVAFRKNNETLIVSADSRTRRALSFFIPGSDRKRLLTVTGLTLDGNYDLEFVQDKDNSSSINGLRVGPPGCLSGRSVESMAIP